MKTIIFLLLSSFSLFGQSTLTPTQSPDNQTNIEASATIQSSFTPFFNNRVTLQSGTLVLLESAEHLSTEQATIGQMIKFIVKTNVIAENKVVINSGAIAIGRVKYVNDNTYNNPETITIEVTNVQAVDGQQVFLNGNELTLSGLYPNEGTFVFTGRTLTANVMNDMEIEVH